MYKFNKALFVFRRDLRVNDNTGLIYALESSKEVICIFIFTPEQITENPYYNTCCVQFMLESLQDLEEQLAKKGGKLWYFFDSPEKVLTKCIRTLQVDLVVVNRDYTPYSVYRDKMMEDICHKHQVTFRAFDDLLLHPIEELLKPDGTPYTIFTPFYKNALKLPVALPRKNLYKNYVKSNPKFAKKSCPLKLKKVHSAQRGGRKEALKILNKLPSFSQYAIKRDYPFQEATTHLSAHLKFTTVSPREVYNYIKTMLGLDSALIRSLHWRDFFSSIAFYFPHVFKSAFHRKFNKLHWENNPTYFKRWCEGRTGFPLVDAGMRQLNQTGYMHNRVRMITASFLVKDLHIHWERGEKYFAQHLIDYDPAVNNGNWQWAASTGCDAQPYFRIFNPWIQQAKFDPECTYIKKWIPELAHQEPHTIHQWYKKESSSRYPLPMVDHAVEAKKALADYKNVS